MPVVILSTDDEAVYGLALQVAVQHGEELSRFEADLLKDSKEEGMRVTFVGHAETRSYGEKKLSPREFYQKLKDLNFPFNKVSQIDLQGCEIGFRKEGTPSYLTEFAGCMYEDPENRHITIKGFTDLLLPENANLGMMFVMTGPQGVEIRGIRKDKLNAYSADLAGRKSSSNAEMIQGIERHGEKFITMDMGMREALDSNDNFSLNFDIYTKQKTFSKYRLQCWAKINNRIAYINQTMPSSDIKTQMLLTLNEAKRNVEDINQNLSKTIDRLINSNIQPPLFADTQKQELINMHQLLSQNLKTFIELKKLLATDNTSLLAGINEENIFEVVYRLLSTHNNHSEKLKIAELILQNKNSYNPADLNPLLFEAADNEDIELIKVLLKYDANPDYVSGGGETPLTLAAKRGYAEVVMALIESGKQNPDQPNQEGWTPLALAVNGGHTEIVKYLLDTNKVNPNKIVHPLGWTPLTIAAQQKNPEIIALLEVAMSRVNQESKDKKSPLSHVSLFSQQPQKSPMPFDDKQTLFNLIASIQKDLEEYRKNQNLVEKYTSSKRTMAEEAYDLFEKLKINLNVSNPDLSSIYEKCQHIVSTTEKRNQIYDPEGGKFGKTINNIKEKMGRYEESRKVLKPKMG